MRRIKLKATQEVFTLRPSFVLPYLVARTAEVEKALFLRHWGVPFGALAYVFGRDAMFWHRAWLRFGRPHLVGTTVKRAAKMPQDVVADEKIAWLAGAEVVVPTTVGSGCVLVSMAAEASSDSLQAAYGEFVAEAQEVFATYQVHSVCTDGFQATREAWRRLCPQLTLVLCYLHSILKIKERCRGALRRQVLDRAWHVYQAATKGQFSQRLRRLSAWAQATLDGAAAEMVSKLCRHRADFTPAYAARGYQLQGARADKEQRPNAKKRQPPCRKLSTLLASTRPKPSHSAPLRAEHGWGSDKAKRPKLTHCSPQSTLGLLKALTRRTCRTPKPCRLN